MGKLSNCLRNQPQSASNPTRSLKPKSNRQHKPLVVVVYSNFSPTTTIEESVKPKISVGGLFLFTYQKVYCADWKLRIYTYQIKLINHP
jgi:hypothetical protein